MTTNFETIKSCCMLIDNKMVKLLKKYHNTDVKIVSKTLRFINKISIEYNVPENEILNYSAYEWYYSNFLNALLTYMFAPWIYTHDKQLSHVQKHDLIYHIYKLVVNKQCKRNITNYYEESFIKSLDFYAIRDNIHDNVKKYISLLKIIFKYGSYLLNKQQQFIKLFIRKKRALKIISNWVACNITWNPNNKIGQKRIKLLSDNFNILVIK